MSGTTVDSKLYDGTRVAALTNGALKIENGGLRLPSNLAIDNE